MVVTVAHKITREIDRRIICIFTVHIGVDTLPDTNLLQLILE